MCKTILMKLIFNEKIKKQDIYDELYEIWEDGICKICGSIIEEMSGLDDSKESEIKFADYKNRCTNLNCREHYWHYVSDQEFLDYYIHKK